MSESEFNPFTATADLFESEGVCRITGHYYLNDPYAGLPVGTPIGYCLVGGIRTVFGGETGQLPGANRAAYYAALLFAAENLSPEDKHAINDSAGFDLLADAEEDNRQYVAEDMLVTYNDQVVGNHTDPVKDQRILDFLRDVAAKWEARPTA